MREFELEEARKFEESKFSLLRRIKQNIKIWHILLIISIIIIFIIVMISQNNKYNNQFMDGKNRELVRQELSLIKSPKKMTLEERNEIVGSLTRPINKNNGAITMAIIGYILIGLSSFFLLGKGDFNLTLDMVMGLTERRAERKIGREIKGGKLINVGPEAKKQYFLQAYPILGVKYWRWAVPVIMEVEGVRKEYIMFTNSETGEEEEFKYCEEGIDLDRDAPNRILNTQAMQEEDNENIGKNV